MSKKNKSSFFEKQMSRRQILKSAGIGSAGLVISASGIGSIFSKTGAFSNSVDEETQKNAVSFYGEHQAGITTQPQDHVYFASLEVTTEEREDLKVLFTEWTKASEAMTKGEPIGDLAENDLLPPVDTGENAGLSPSNLTITFGVGPTLFVKDGKDRFGLESKKPAELEDMPEFSLDALEDNWSDGDLCIQACSDDAQVCFHAVRNLIRIGRGKVSLKWAQEGFQRTKKASEEDSTPRNLFGFKDGTINPEVDDEDVAADTLWVQSGDGPDWLAGGTYLVVRRIQMFIEVWDRTTLQDQENTFGRKRGTGAPLGQKKEFDELDLNKKDENGEFFISKEAHTRRAHGKGEEQIWRRPYSYASGMDPKTGTFDAGLFFLSFQRSPSKQFVPIQKRLAALDELNEYILHRGSAVFACLPGAQKGGFIGDSLF